MGFFMFGLWFDYPSGELSRVRHRVIAADHDDNIWTGYMEKYELEKYSADGRLLLKVSRVARWFLPHKTGKPWASAMAAIMAPDDRAEVLRLDLRREAATSPKARAARLSQGMGSKEASTCSCSISSAQVPGRRIRTAF
jgi:hypothetical protein